MLHKVFYVYLVSGWIVSDFQAMFLPHSPPPSQMMVNNQTNIECSDLIYILQYTSIYIYIDVQ